MSQLGGAADALDDGPDSGPPLPVQVAEEER
eukprot:CAMPEP_0118918378 /NCGR_PEP_ID=MMETSP1166-20130328/17880_1 /TAXON_ID=1104430 /ORGANISM="Chrysoreinhardia sp, Strain CCMP3193" /LENGTH=30 /DNA_ID= /DNA_START= /DNA_END= /DNA_ORIENTATION=